MQGNMCVCVCVCVCVWRDLWGSDVFLMLHTTYGSVLRAPWGVGGVRKPGFGDGGQTSTIGSLESICRTGFTELFSDDMLTRGGWARFSRSWVNRSDDEQMEGGYEQSGTQTTTAAAELPTWLAVCVCLCVCVCVQWQRRRRGAVKFMGYVRR